MSSPSVGRRAKNVAADAGGGEGHDIGKAPVQFGINNSSNKVDEVWNWWVRWPEANVEVDLGKSGIFGIGPHSEEWHEKFKEYGLPETAIVESGGGAGHYHYYYRRPEDCVQFNINIPEGYDAVDNTLPRCLMSGPGV